MRSILWLPAPNLGYQRQLTGIHSSAMTGKYLARERPAGAASLLLPIRQKSRGALYLLYLADILL